MKLQGRLGALAERNFRLVFSSDDDLRDRRRRRGDRARLRRAAHLARLADRRRHRARLPPGRGGRDHARGRGDRRPAAAPPRARRRRGDPGGRAGGRRRRSSSAATRRCALLAVLGAVYGLADGFVIPASNGLIPAVVSKVAPAAGECADRAQPLDPRLRRAGARRHPRRGGQPRLGDPDRRGELRRRRRAARRACTSTPRADVVEPEPFLRELREGWTRVPPAALDLQHDRVLRDRQLRRRDVGRARAARDEGALRRCARPRRSCSSASAPGSCSAACRAALASVAAAARVVPRRDAVRARRSGCSRASCRCPCCSRARSSPGIGLAIHLALWFTVFQQQVPEAARSRVSSYDALGSFVLIPLGTAVAGPIAAAVGVRPTLLGAGVVILATNLAVLAQPAVWGIRRARAEPAAA